MAAVRESLERERHASDEEFAEFSEEMSVDAEPGHQSWIVHSRRCTLAKVMERRFGSALGLMVDAVPFSTLISLA